jgi:hypothetical protein
VTDELRELRVQKGLAVHDDDPLGLARGVVYAAALCVPFWLVVAALAWWAL